MGHYVYKYVQDGEIVYIGKNDTDLKTRILQHANEDRFQSYLSSDVYYIPLSNRAESTGLEALLINKYKPKLNIKDIYEDTTPSFQLIEPEWRRYKGALSPNRRGKSENKHSQIKKSHLSIEDFLKEFQNKLLNKENQLVLANLINSKDSYGRLRKSISELNKAFYEKGYKYILISKRIKVNKDKRETYWILKEL